ncbi:MAG TPA: hypothetical protein VF546_18940 [Pyrinomonadaceae bacterium]|jgi:hypothetical protein
MMISEEELDEIVERARALGTDYAVLADLLRLSAEVRRLRAPVEAAERLLAERLRLNETEAALEATLERSRAGLLSVAVEIDPSSVRGQHA